MSIIRTKRKSKDFTVISNKVLQDSNLSFEARGVLSYLLSKPDDWVCRMADIQKNGSIGRDKTRRIINELHEKGYAKRQFNSPESGHAKGSFWVIYEDPTDRPPENTYIGNNDGKTDPLKNRPPEKPTPCKPVPIQRTDLQRTDIQRKESVYTRAHENFSNPLKDSQCSGPAGGAADQDPKKKLMICLKSAGAAEKKLWQGVLGKRSMTKAARIFVNHKLATWQTDKAITHKTKFLSQISFRADFEKSLNWIIEIIDRENKANGKNTAKTVYHR